MVRPITTGLFKIVSCLQCSKEIRSYLTSPRKFCSRECLGLHARGDRQCDHCGKKLTSPISHGRRFCSKKCRGEARKLPHGDAACNEVIARYKRHAKARGLEWALKKSDAVNLFLADCYWCGDAPSNREFKERNNGGFTYNGIDRVDNAVGYYLKNCVPCCFVCNSMKRDFTKDVFLEKVKKIAWRHG